MVSPNKENIHLTNWEIVSVNPTNKNWNWKDIFCFWTVGTQSIISFALLGSLYLLYNLNFYEVLFGSILASILVCFFSNLGGAPSQRHGIPFPVFLRISTGYLGAKYISLLRGFVGLFFKRSRSRMGFKGYLSRNDAIYGAPNNWSYHYYYIS